MLLSNEKYQFRLIKYYYMQTGKQLALRYLQESSLFKIFYLNENA
jgi:hypothetical protein